MEGFDVFFSYSSRDRLAVEQVARWLQLQGIKVWLDRWSLRPGLPWQEGIENGIASSRAVAVFVGEGGLGHWEIPELRAALAEHVRRGSPVIPILLPGSAPVDALPMFLKGHHTIEFKLGLDDANAREALVWGITGKAPERTQAELSTGNPPALVDAFIINRSAGAFERVLESAVFPALKQLGLSWVTITDIEQRVGVEQLAAAMADAVLDADILIANLDPETPWVPLALQNPPPPGKTTIVLATRDVAIPEALNDVLRIRYHSGRAGLPRLRREFCELLAGILGPEQLGEAETLFRLKLYKSALISASNYMHDFLRQRALSALGYKFFKETPIRYYSLSRLFFVLVKKGKLCLPELGRMDWQRLAKLRNENTHGESDSEVDESTCREYIDTVKEIVRLNSKN